MKKQLRITVNGNSYDVEAEILENDQVSKSPVSPAIVSLAGTESSPARTAKPKPVRSRQTAPGDVPSPIAGTVISIPVTEGSEVNQGDVLLVLEAMKMNTEVTSPSAGKVVKISVSQGQSVEEGQSLLTLC